MATVIIAHASYEYPALKHSIDGMLDRFAGPRIGPGKRVLIKPNFVAPSPPERAMVTHPLVLKAVVEYVASKGATALVADSPAIGSVGAVLKRGGFSDALTGLPVQCFEFSRSVTRDLGDPFRQVELAAEVFEADLVINLPKLKTHAQMLLTLGVKNLFGCVVGLRKPEWHLRAGVDREFFARLIVSIYGSIRPAITILDGVLAMEGQGPGTGGTPRELGVLMASDDAVALDHAVCDMLGMPADDLLTNRIAQEKGLAPTYSVEGRLPRIVGFKLPRTTSLVFGPRRLQRFMRTHLVQRPSVIGSRCKRCGACWEICPAKAITHREAGLKFDYDRCIRCYCCLEVCPHAALEAKEPLAGKIIKKLGARS